MKTLQDLIPDPEMILDMEPEDIAPYLLELAKTQAQSAGFNINNAVLTTRGIGMAAENGFAYDKYESQINLIVNEGWNWLRVHGLLIPASGMNGANGWLVPSRRALKMKSPADFASFCDAAAFPKSLLHPSIADRVWRHLARQEFDVAVLIAFRTVEEEVRRLGGYGHAEYGTALMRKAFDPDKGPLRDPKQEKGEREALAHLFTGAIGSYKNPHSHRTIVIEDAQEAQEMVVLASHLLRIVDDRIGDMDPDN